LFLVDLVVAEVVYVLELFYEVPRPQVAELVRAIPVSRPFDGSSPAGETADLAGGAASIADHW
jgi:hypothetical protein